MNEVKRVLGFHRIIMLLFAIVVLTVLEVDADSCSGYISCASCTNAHYEYTQRRVMDRTSIKLEESKVDLLSVQSEKRHRLRISSSSKEEVWWPHRRPTCVWCPHDGRCSSKSNPAECLNKKNDSSSHIEYEYECPLAPIPYPKDPPSVLPDWMGKFLESGALKNLALSDICLPGTHDTLTYDLSLTVSDDGIDEIRRISDLLHALSGGTIKILPGEIEEFFRLQAKTQQLTVTQQLDNGIRFFDIRLMMENDNQEWYSIHFMQSNKEIREYFKEIRVWMDKHPSEVVVLWLSKHGNPGATGNDQYPDVSPSEKQQLWKDYVAIFDGLLLDSKQSSIQSTPMEELIRLGHRLVTFATDWVEFTNSSTLALDGAKIQNYYRGDGVFDASNVYKDHMQYLENARDNNAKAAERSRFTLMSMNTAGTSWQVTDTAKHRFLHWLNQKNSAGERDEGSKLESFFKSCASHTKIPGLNNWCPATLLDISQLSSFYNQVVIESAYNMHQSNPSVAFPHAFYLDALDYDGTIRTGTQLLDGSERTATSASHKITRYAYVDTVLAYNARQACGINQQKRRDTPCNSTLLELIDRRRARNPLQRWEEQAYGRRVDWPFDWSENRDWSMLS